MTKKNYIRNEAKIRDTGIRWISKLKERYLFVIYVTDWEEQSNLQFKIELNLKKNFHLTSSVLYTVIIKNISRIIHKNTQVKGEKSSTIHTSLITTHFAIHLM